MDDFKTPPENATLLPEKARCGCDYYDTGSGIAKIHNKNCLESPARVAAATKVDAKAEAVATKADAKAATVKADAKTLAATVKADAKEEAATVKADAAKKVVKHG